MKEKKARVEDALHATRAAVEEGIVAGGGVAPAARQTVAPATSRVTKPRPGRRHQDRARAIEEPMRASSCRTPATSRAWSSTRCWAAGQLRLQRPERRVRRHGRDGHPDPTKVTRTALQNAASVAALMLTTEAMISEAPKEEPPAGRHARRHGRHGRHGRDGHVIPSGRRRTMPGDRCRNDGAAAMRPLSLLWPPGGWR